MKQCPNVCTCRLFTNQIPIGEDSKMMYKSHYCLKREEMRWKQCKRFLLKEQLGDCPDYVMPNSLLSFEQIMQRIGLEKSFSY